MKKGKVWGLAGRFFIVLTLAGVLLLGPSVKQAPAQDMKPMKLLANGGPYPEKFPDNIILTYFCKEVEEKTKGVISFRYAWSGSLTKPGEEIDAMKGGLAQVGTVAYNYYPSKLYLSNLCRAVPFVSTDVGKQTAILNQLYSEVPALNGEWEKYGTKLLVTIVSNSFELQSLAPMVKLEDFKGKKIVIGGVRAKEWFQVIGAAPVTVPLPERALAFQTKMIDGSVVPFPVARPFGLDQYAKHATFIGLGAWQACGLVINKELFDGFPEDIKQIILDAADKAGKYNVQVRMKANETTIEGMKKHGVTFHTLPDAEKIKWMDLMGNQPMDWIEKGEKMGLPARKVMETYLSLIEKSGYQFPRKW